MPIGGVQLATIALMGIVTTFSVPSIPGGTIIVMVPILISVGLPAEGIGVLIGIDAITDMFRTATNVTADMAGAAVIGRKQRAAGTAPVAAAHEPAP